MGLASRKRVPLLDSQAPRPGRLLNARTLATDDDDVVKEASKTTGSDRHELAARVTRLFAVVMDQLRDDPTFAERIREALEPVALATPPTSPERPPVSQPSPAVASAPAPSSPRKRRAVIDPFALYDSGWEPTLRSQLDRLTADQLLDVIHQYELDPRGKAAAVHDAQSLRDLIVSAVEDLGMKRLR